MTSLPRVRARSNVLPEIILFVLAATAHAVLGIAVSHVQPMGIDAAARSVAGEAPRIAWIFTESCLWPTLTVFGLAGCIAAARFRAWRARIIFATVTTLVTWQTSDALKNLFGRPRPAYWIVHHESSYAYSSGHAMFATLVYWLWAYYVARSDAPAVVRVSLCALLVAWGVGVIWSRLALGAHYPSDLVGGILLAIAALAVAHAIARTIAPQTRVL